VYLAALQSSTADARPGSGPETSSRSTVEMADAVKGLLIMRRESLVEWARIRLAVSRARSRALMLLSLGVGDFEVDDCSWLIRVDVV